MAAFFKHRRDAGQRGLINFAGVDAERVASGARLSLRNSHQASAIWICWSVSVGALTSCSASACSFLSLPRASSGRPVGPIAFVKAEPAADG